MNKRTVQVPKHTTSSNSGIGTAPVSLPEEPWANKPLTTVADIEGQGLSQAQAERVALLMEELGELQQVLGKVLRHGWDSYNPVTGETNRQLFTLERNDVRAAIKLIEERDGFATTTDYQVLETLRRKSKYMHHQ